MKCSECGSDLPVQVLRSAAGFYIGRFCPQCGPYMRMSGYYESEESAKKDLHIYKKLADKPFWG